MAEEKKLKRVMRIGFYSDPLEITENGIHNVADYSSVNVNVAGGSSSGIEPLSFEEYKSLVDNGSIVKDGRTITLDTSGNTTYLVEV